MSPSIESTTAGNSYSDIPAWDRTDTVAGKKTSIFDINNKSIEYNLGTSAEVSKNPRFIVEYLGPAENTETTLYRITARAWGRNQNTQVTLQSIIRVNNTI